MMAFNFYQLIPPMPTIHEITNPNYYYDVPADWFIALTDVMNSTGAIENGRYKDVNAIAAASIMALLNQAPDHDLPFVFGGDGATVLIPPNLLEGTRMALIATRRLAREQFDLQLRVGVVPVQDVLRDGYRIRVARLWMSENFQQAIFSGGGLEHAEKLLKDPSRAAHYGLPEDPNATADFSGFECRWNEIPSPSEETVSLMVKATNDDHNALYVDVLQRVEAIYGDSLARHPIRMEYMSVAKNPLQYRTETRIREGKSRLGRLIELALKTIGASWFMRFDIGGWERYKAIVSAATDTEKFDDTLRMLLSGRRDQRQRLESFLEAERAAGRLVYGLHAAKNALMTCLIFDRFGRQVHFVDAADGGYALAARAMKAQLSQR